MTVLRELQFVLGVLGASLAGYFLWLYLRVISGPGDDNPVGLLALASVGLALVPSYGPVSFAWQTYLAVARAIEPTFTNSRRRWHPGASLMMRDSAR